MSVNVVITAGDVKVEAELNDTESAKAIAETLPIQAEANTWGEEIYFSIDVDCTPEEMQGSVDLGDLGYWPPGSAFCMFFGLTPMSTADEIRPASPVIVIGRMQGDLEALKAVKSGAPVSIERA
ncbi:MAG: hypothetical protein GX131_06180 [candidate division WS1 bacterium]|jgi:hypothetical protein|nr:hypothetical protein [candidate division WS1 bacterium]